MMLGTIERLISLLDADGIRYCHWKSNWTLARTLEGDTDLDMLIHPEDAARFREVLKDLGFKPSFETGIKELAGVEHRHALDEEAGRLVHIHAYERIVTGESLAKNYELPIAEQILGTVRRQSGMPIPSAGAELIVFMLRMLIKHTTAVELALVMRDRRSFEAEVKWLMSEAALAEALELLPTWFSSIEPDLFIDAYRALEGPGPVWRRVVVGLKVRKRLRPHARVHPFRAQVVGVRRFTRRLWFRVRGSAKKLSPGGGGMIIAFVGSEATGKSTVISEIAGWFGDHFTLCLIHAGKPPSTMLTWAPHRLLPVLRRLFPRQRSSHVESAYRDTPGRNDSYPLAFALRSVMLGYERKVLLQRAARYAAAGTIVLSDRYPSDGVGAPDGAQLTGVPEASDGLRRRLAAQEARLYNKMPAPDLVLFLTAPLDVTIERNAAREKVEDEAFVRTRHALSEHIDFSTAPVALIETDRPFEDVLRDIKNAIWDAL
jgi:thymidylate kinase